MSRAPFSDLPADLKARLEAVGVTDEASLWRALDADTALKADVEAFLRDQRAQFIEQLLAAFLAVSDSAALAEFWQQVPLELEDTFIATVEQAIAQAEQGGESDVAAGLRQRLDGLRRLQAEQQATLPPQLQQTLDRYLELHQAAEQSEHDVSAWQTTIEAGEALLAPEFAETPGANWPTLHADLASTYTNLGIAYETARDLDAALAAFERAIALQPDFAMWRRNRAGTLIDLGRLGEAETEIAAARALEPDAPRLVELDGQLEQARTKAPLDPKEGD
jgi:tetratricopeptide (TPR) repeat protein